VKTQQLVDHIGDEVSILEVAEGAKIDDETKNQPSLPFALAAGFVYQLAVEVAEQGSEYQYGDEDAARLVIKEETGGAKKCVAHGYAFAYERASHQHHQKEHPEVELREQ
jgi:hypothetical protein